MEWLLENVDDFSVEKRSSLRNPRWASFAIIHDTSTVEGLEKEWSKKKKRKRYVLEEDVSHYVEKKDVYNV